MVKPYQRQLDFYLLVPCYNNLPGLILSLQSVVYDYNKFAVLIIDDGSCEMIDTACLKSKVSQGLHLEIIRMPENSGITKALNSGLEYLEKENNFQFIARLDCGDICHADRFYLQMEFLWQNPSIDLVGSWCIFKDFLTGFSYQYRTPTDHEEIKKGMHFRNLFIHPTVMWRREAMVKTGFYPEEFPCAEDYGFFYQFLNNGRCAVIAQNLVTCEINANGISMGFRKQQLKSRIKVVRQFGENKLLAFIGICKLRLLMTIPYPLVLQAKRIFFG
jgi:glycosyltransferase involved in cell wall biosynthesis